MDPSTGPCSRFRCEQAETRAVDRIKQLDRPVGTAHLDATVGPPVEALGRGRSPASHRRKMTTVEARSVTVALPSTTGRCAGAAVVDVVTCHAAFEALSLPLARRHASALR